MQPELCTCSRPAASPQPDGRHAPARAVPRTLTAATKWNRAVRVPLGLAMFAQRHIEADPRRTSFLLRLNDNCMLHDILFMHSFVARHSGCPHLWAPEATLLWPRCTSVCSSPCSQLFWVHAQRPPMTLLKHTDKTSAALYQVLGVKHM